MRSHFNDFQPPVMVALFALGLVHKVDPVPGFRSLRFPDFRFLPLDGEVVPIAQRVEEAIGAAVSLLVPTTHQ